jgi:hypothetical protein
MVRMTACSGVIPWRMNSTHRKAPQVMMFDSPRPVEPAAPTVLSQYCPAPMMGESPTRPGTFHAMPLVVVTELRSPAAFSAFMLIVPVENLIITSSSWSSQKSLGLRRDFQRSQSWRLFSVSSGWGLNPMLTAKRRASSPTSMMWSV